MGSLNRVTLVGYLGRDIEVRHTKDGTPVGHLTLATTDTWRTKAGEKRERTEWHRVVLWGDLAQTLEPYLRKGKQICVEGSLFSREWEDRQWGKRTSVEIKAHRVVLLGGGARPEHDERGGGEDEDVPF